LPGPVTELLILDGPSSLKNLNELIDLCFRYAALYFKSQGPNEIAETVNRFVSVCRLAPGQLALRSLYDEFGTFKELVESNNLRIDCVPSEQFEGTKLLLVYALF
jgi:hypothetical protein